MKTRHGRPILVTGSHRSGSTFVGHMIAAHPKVIYVSEPFNPGTYRDKTPLKLWFYQVTPPDEARVRAWLHDPVTFYHSWWNDFCDRPSLRRLAGATRRKLTSWYRQLSGCRPLLKDPIALMSAPWLAHTYGSDVVVLIRHPAAFVSSLVRLNWHVRFSDFLAQPELMCRLTPFTEELRDFVAHPRPVLDQGILVWRVFHHVIRQYQEEHPEWLFVRHEDISQRPGEMFQSIFDHLELSMTAEVRQAVAKHTASGNPAEAPANVVHQLQRDSEANVWNWKRRLSPADASRIQKLTHDVASHFYSEANWVGEAGQAARVG